MMRSGFPNVVDLGVAFAVTELLLVMRVRFGRALRLTFYGISRGPKEKNKDDVIQLSRANESPLVGRVVFSVALLKDK